MCDIRTHNGKLPSHKKWWTITICNNVDGSWEYHAKWNKSDGKKQEPHDFTHMWNVKQKATNEQKNKFIDIDNRILVTWREWGVEGGQRVSRGSNIW